MSMVNTFVDENDNDEGLKVKVIQVWTSTPASVSSPLDVGSRL